MAGAKRQLVKRWDFKSAADRVSPLERELGRWMDTLDESATGSFRIGNKPLKVICDVCVKLAELRSERQSTQEVKHLSNGGGRRGSLLRPMTLLMLEVREAQKVEPREEVGLGGVGRGRLLPLLVTFLLQLLEELGVGGGGLCGRELLELAKRTSDNMLPLLIFLKPIGAKPHGEHEIAKHALIKIQLIPDATLSTVKVEVAQRRPNEGYNGKEYSGAGCGVAGNMIPLATRVTRIIGETFVRLLRPATPPNRNTRPFNLSITVMIPNELLKSLGQLTNEITITGTTSTQSLFDLLKLLLTKPGPKVVDFVKKVLNLVAEGFGTTTPILPIPPRNPQDPVYGLLQVDLRNELGLCALVEMAIDKRLGATEVEHVGCPSSATEVKGGEGAGDGGCGGGGLATGRTTFCAAFIDAVVNALAKLLGFFGLELLNC
ncbi:HD domain-containing protein [Babesia caballi]|uniref:HD domain-containing protein n=1 Tax=Babesia caballi TaxID=5871 RepID=A0AAV4LPX7_BABCB|nr:HD domain-containing protein [Babesia caballi]